MLVLKMFFALVVCLAFDAVDASSGSPEHDRVARQAASTFFSPHSPPQSSPSAGRFDNDFPDSIGNALRQRIFLGKQMNVEWETRLKFSQDRECGACGQNPTYMPSPSYPPQFLDVPCNRSNTVILAPSGVPARLNLSSVLVGSIGAIVQEVYDSSPHDNNSYVTVDPVSGEIRRGAIGPSVDTTQTVRFVVYGAGSPMPRESVYITFRFHSCALQLSCPDLVTYYACCFYDIDFTPLRCSITNPGITNISILWDQPGNFGLNNPTLRTFQGFAANDARNPPNAPLVLTSNITLSITPPNLNNPIPPGTSAADQAKFFNTGLNPVDNNLFIVSANGLPQHAADATGPIGFYISNTANGYYALGCQQILVSATPQFAETPFVAGSRVVTLCGVGNTADRKSCAFPASAGDGVPIPPAVASKQSPLAGVSVGVSSDDTC